MVEKALEALRKTLSEMSEVAVAVSGGVDSMTLAVVAHRHLQASGHEGNATQMYHAVSPAVPPDATERVNAYAAREGWVLQTVDAGEFEDAAYRANPANRCYFCKSNLYGTMAGLSSRLLLSGTNLDDLGDYRPGLKAAEANAVRHPYVEAGIDKKTVRAIARYLQLDDLAELPAAPCLSSRIETGIAIDPATLTRVYRVERMLRDELAPDTVRCRVRNSEIGIELDQATLERLSLSQQQVWRERIATLFAEIDNRPHVAFEAYRMGSAFLRPNA